MYKYLKTILTVFLLACCLGQAQKAMAWQLQPKLQVQQAPPPEEQTPEKPPPPEADQEVYDDNEPIPEDEYSDEVYTDEEKTSPFPEIVSPPKRVEREVNNAQWSKLTNDKDFQYEEPKPAKSKNSNTNWIGNAFYSFFAFLASTVGNYLVVGIVVLIVLIIIIRIVQLKGNIFFSRKDKKLVPDETDETSDGYIPDDWEKVIQDAARAGNYRLAVRHGYRYLLSMLQEHELIHFQVAKTNYQYVFELAGTQLHKPFMQLTRDYEYAWYGGFNIQQERFEEYYQKVSSIKKELNPNG